AVKRALGKTLGKTFDAEAGPEDVTAAVDAELKAKDKQIAELKKPAKKAAENGPITGETVLARMKKK
ncbi:MAG: hypothetical protein ACOCTS_03375, partial [Thermodesulfobacteriota bacterium]